MSLNSQIFSLRQAIIKAKRKAKHEHSSDSNSSSSQQSVDYIPPNHDSSHVHSKSLLLSSKSPRNKYSPKQQSTKQLKINTVAKDLYSSRKNKLFYSQNKTSIYQTNLSQTYNGTGQDKNQNKLPLTDSNKFHSLNGQESRVSNFTINSQISTKTKIHQQLIKLNKIIPDRPSETSPLKNIHTSTNQNPNTLFQYQDCSLFHESSNQTLSYEHKTPDYFVSYQELEIPSLFGKINYSQSKVKINSLKNNPNSESIHEMITEWKILRSDNPQNKQVQSY